VSSVSFLFITKLATVGTVVAAYVQRAPGYIIFVPSLNRLDSC
jgi:hypothetical protein